jgi:hypothetical protein
VSRTGLVAGVVAALALAGAGCSADSGETPSASSVPPNDMPLCSEVYVEGAIVDNTNFGLACVENEAIVSPRPVRLECSDGQELLFNDLAWGYFGQPMTLTPRDDPSKMPEAEVDACLAPPRGGTTTTVDGEES